MILRGSTLHSERLKLREHGVAAPVAAPTPVIVAMPQVSPVVDSAPPARPDARQLVEKIRSLESADRAIVLDAFADDLQGLRQRAIDEGRRAGEARCRDEARETLAHQQMAMNTFFEQVAAHFERERVAMEASCVDIVAEALVKLVGSVLTTPEALAGAVKQVAQMLPPGDALRIRTHPDDVEVLAGGRGDLAAMFPGRQVELVADANVGVGGCIIDGANGHIDARWETQLERMLNSLARARAAVTDR